MALLPKVEYPSRRYKALDVYSTIARQDMKPPFLDGKVVSTKQVEPIMPLKDPTSDMAIISCKGSALVGEIHEKQSRNKSCQRFWEIARSKLGDALGVEKTAEQLNTWNFEIKDYILAS